MKIIFKNDSAEKQFSSDHKNKWRYPKKVIEKLLATENFLQQATSLKDVFVYPPFHFHPLKGDRKHEWAINLGKTGFRVTLIPCKEDGTEILSGDIMSQCAVIKIVKVTEVSNHYE